MCVARIVGIAVIDRTNYHKRPSPQRPNELIRHLECNLDRTDAPRPGDVLAFSWQDSGLVYHVGIMATETTMIHAWAGGRKVMETPIGDWAGRLHSAWSFRGVA